MPPRGMSLEAQLNTGFPLPLAGLLPKLVPSFLELKPQFRPAKANTYEALQAVSLSGLQGGSFSPVCQRGRKQEILTSQQHGSFQREASDNCHKVAWSCRQRRLRSCEFLQRLESQSHCHEPQTSTLASGSWIAGIDLAGRRQKALKSETLLSRRSLHKNFKLPNLLQAKSRAATVSFMRHAEPRHLSYMTST